MHKEWENARKLGNSNTLAHCFTIWATLAVYEHIWFRLWYPVATVFSICDHWGYPSVRPGCWGYGCEIKFTWFKENV